MKVLCAKLEIKLIGNAGFFCWLPNAIGKCREGESFLEMFYLF